MTTKKAIVSGLVQGVFYRATTRNKAIGLGVTGYAKNLPDGKVEVMAQGEPEAVDMLLEWLWQGSTHSQVTAVEISDILDPGKQYNSFSTY